MKPFDAWWRPLAPVPSLSALHLVAADMPVGVALKLWIANLDFACTGVSGETDRESTYFSFCPKRENENDVPYWRRRCLLQVQRCRHHRQESAFGIDAR